MQAPYPKIFGEAALPSWQSCDMARLPLDPEDSFDRNLVRERMKEVGCTQAMLAKELGLNQSAISNILKGPREGGRHVKAHEAFLIYKHLGLKRESDVQKVPKIGITSAGNWREAILHPDGEAMVPRGLAGDNAFAVQVQGDSMDEVVNEGEYVVVDPDQTHLFNDKIYLLQNVDYETQIKQYRTNPARFEPMSSNDTHEAIYVGRDQFQVIGRVVWRAGPL